jgi:hypothetical protein
MPGKFAKAASLAAALVAAAAPMSAWPQSSTNQVLREQTTLRIQDATETWRLVWDGKPGEVCRPDDVEDAATCPCSGFAYAESGKLALIRQRDGKDLDSLDLGPLFANTEHPTEDVVPGPAVLVRWPFAVTDMDRDTDPDLVGEVKRRAPPKIMRFADYDHDGLASEFLIQVGAGPCGHTQFAAVGLSGQTHHLHALTTAAHPDRPLIMPRTAWEALLKGPNAHTVRTLECGDHGSDVREELVVSALNGAIHAKARSFTCSENGSEKQATETDL